MSAPRRAPRRRVDGVVLFDKPLGISSNHALQAVRRLFNAEKAGHTGTLDPLATGLLPLCLGEATKFAGELLDADKRYLATIQLGATTATADAEGVVLERRPVTSTRQEIELACREFVGEIDQVPPMYSALKRDGKPLYEYARAGIELDRPSRRITIYSITPGEFASDRFVIEVHCSKGTYIRTLAADIGEHLGCGAHLAALRRTAIGFLRVENAHPLAKLEAVVAEARDDLLQPVDALLPELPVVRLGIVDAGKLRHGQSVPWIGVCGERLRVYDDTYAFMGVCSSVDGWLKPQRLLSTQS